jgi:hypothetical protein
MSANRFMTLVVSACALLSFAACSRSSSKALSASPEDGTPAPALTPTPSPTQPEPSLAVTCAPASATAGQGPVTCAAALANADGTIAWTLTGPGSLSASTGAAVHYAPPIQLDADAISRVVAAAAGLAASFDIHVSPSAKRASGISGHVVDAGGHPVAGVMARVAGYAATTTDDAGAFTIPEVAPPYDLVLSTSGLGRIVEVYAGLTRTDPTVAIYQAGLAATGIGDRSANLAGRVSGGDPAAKGGHNYQGVLFASTELPAGDPLEAVGTAVARPPDSYKFPVSWRGTGSLRGAVLAVQWRADPGTAAPTAYWLAMALDVDVADGATTSIPPLELSAVPAVTTVGTVRLPPRYALKLTSAQMTPWTQKSPFSLFHDDNAGVPWGDPPIFRYVLPTLVGTDLQLCARAANTAPGHLDSVAMGCVEASGLAAVDVPVTAAPEPFVPANGANAVGLDTVFAWQPFPEGVNVLEVTPDGPDAPAFLVFTASSRAALPDLGDEALSLPSRASYHWRVRGLAPVASVDALAAPGAVPPPLDYPSPHGSRWAWGRSTAYQFTAR